VGLPRGTVLASADFLRLPSNVSQDLGAILEPLGVAIHASRRASLKIGSTVLVFGAGAVGLLCAAICKVSGAKTVIIADIQADRVDFAVQNKFADSKIVVPIKRFETIEDKLSFAKDVAELVMHLLEEMLMLSLNARVSNLASRLRYMWVSTILIGHIC
jgi:threonine dehydrogenase-like Zn-dependent dehydrogenase